METFNTLKLNTMSYKIFSEKKRVIETQVAELSQQIEALRAQELDSFRETVLKDQWFKDTVWIPDEHNYRYSLDLNTLDPKYLEEFNKLFPIFCGFIMLNNRFSINIMHNEDDVNYDTESGEPRHDISSMSFFSRPQDLIELVKTYGFKIDISFIEKKVQSHLELIEQLKSIYNK